ncbi:MAG: protein-disulfide reductase DsbD family protein [Niabella sp.]
MIKKVFLLLCTVMSIGLAHAQLDPVSWKFSTKKISDNVYEAVMTATLKPGWHLYSQIQPKDAIALPTEFEFAKNPLVTMSGAVKEVGKLQKVKDPALGSTAHQYANTVTFVQKITLKTKAKTTLSGTVEYQTCDDSKCLPPKKVPFKLQLG